MGWRYIAHISCGELANKFQNSIVKFPGVLGEQRQQFFRTTPGASFVSEGGRAILTCVIGDLGGRVQWTKDGLTLGAEFMIAKDARSR